MKKRPPTPRRDANKDWCYTAGRVYRDHNRPVDTIKELRLYEDFGSSRAEDLERAFRDGWNARDREIRKEPTK